MGRDVLLEGLKNMAGGGGEGSEGSEEIESRYGDSEDDYEDESEDEAGERGSDEARRIGASLREDQKEESITDDGGDCHNSEGGDGDGCVGACHGLGRLWVN